MNLASVNFYRKMKLYISIFAAKVAAVFLWRKNNFVANTAKMRDNCGGWLFVGCTLYFKTKTDFSFNLSEYLFQQLKAKNVYY